MLLLVEEEVVAAEGHARQGARAFLDVALGVVVAFAEREELHQLAREVLVRAPAAVLVVVEVLQHRRVADDAAHEIGEVAGGVRAQERVLREHVVAVLDRAVAGREVPVPEERELLLERAARRDHLREPPLLHLGELLAVGLLARLALALEPENRLLVACRARAPQRLALLGRLGPHHSRELRRWRQHIVALEVDDVVDRVVEAELDQRAHLRGRAAEAGAVQQVLRGRVVEVLLGEWLERVRHGLRPEKERTRRAVSV